MTNNASNFPMPSEKDVKDAEKILKGLQGSYEGLSVTMVYPDYSSAWELSGYLKPPETAFIGTREQGQLAMVLRLVPSKPMIVFTPACVEAAPYAGAVERMLELLPTVMDTRVEDCPIKTRPAFTSTGMGELQTTFSGELEQPAAMSFLKAKYAEVINYIWNCTGAVFPKAGTASSRYGAGIISTKKQQESLATALTLGTADTALPTGKNNGHKLAQWEMEVLAAASVDVRPCGNETVDRVLSAIDEIKKWATFWHHANLVHDFSVIIDVHELKNGPADAIAAFEAEIAHRDLEPFVEAFKAGVPDSDLMHEPDPKSNWYRPIWYRSNWELHFP